MRVKKFTIVSAMSNEMATFQAISKPEQVTMAVIEMVLNIASPFHAKEWCRTIDRLNRGSYATFSMMEKSEEYGLVGKVVKVTRV